jgi:putative protease
MKILSPLDRTVEVAPLIEAGADEFYAGVIPDGWAHRNLLVNQRSFASAQFPSEAEFATAVREASARDVPVHLALNAPLYDPSLYPDLLALAERAASWGTAGLIVGDPGMLSRLAERGLPLEITLSTLAGTLNRHALSFHRSLGISRAVLPRHLTLEEVGSMVASAPGLLFEVFILVGKCPNEEAHCTFLHVSPAKRWPCEIAYDYGTEEGICAEDHPRVVRARRWERLDRRMGCGVCAIPELRRLGVGVLKLVGRGGPTEGKAANLRFVRRFAEADDSRDRTMAAYAERFGRPCDPLICYFPELHPDKPARRKKGTDHRINRARP